MVRFVNGSQLTNSMTELFSKVDNYMSIVLTQQASPERKAVGAGLPQALAVEPSNIVFPVLIGHFPLKDPFEAVAKTHYSTSFSLNDNRVVHRPSMPTPTGATTFHRALFGNRARSGPAKVPHPAADSKRVMTRVATAQVLLSIGCANGGKHAVIVDFTDPEHPGVFDPNFGWIEPRQGFCFLDFEQLMLELWEEYTKNNLTNKEQGLQQITLAAGDKDLYILAFQLYVQLA